MKLRFGLAYIAIGFLAFAWTLGIGYAVGHLHGVAHKSDLGNANVRAIAEQAVATAAQQQGLPVLGMKVTKVVQHGPNQVDVYILLKSPAGTIKLDVVLDKGLYQMSDIKVVP